MSATTATVPPWCSKPADQTWQAYNTYGGSDFYQGAANGRSYKVSYNRPIATRGGPGGRDFYFSNEYPMVRFLEQNGYDVSYISGLDTNRNGAELLNHKVFLSVGHDEYWSGPQRANVTAARDAGVNLQFLSGNEMYWRTRFEPSTVDGAANRTLTCYKETWAQAKIDPSTQWTGTWRDPRFASQANGGGLPENGRDRNPLHVQPLGPAGDRERGRRKNQALAEHLPGLLASWFLSCTGPAHRGL